MIRAWLPIGFAVALLLGLSAWEAVLSDRFRGSGISAEVVAERFAKIPIEIPGTSWTGEDKEVDKEILRVAGAVNHINRTYLNADTGESVDLWLICGHARDVCRHTPNICYISQGFRQVKTQLKHEIKAPGEKAAEFYTAEFNSEEGGAHRVRVFWSWNGNEPEHDTWEAPDPNPRRTYGNNTALYKLYFTARVTPDEVDANDNVAVAFAKVMLPEINAALFPSKDASSLDVADEPDADAAEADEDQAAANDDE
ncbi:MAG: exosortase-associated EpsI family protein [Pirellulales bacterium]|nr:exosortase-associated EpsI family protein [Pirellulales bacterium]